MVKDEQGKYTGNGNLMLTRHWKAKKAAGVVKSAFGKCFDWDIFNCRNQLCRLGQESRFICFSPVLLGGKIGGVCLDQKLLQGDNFRNLP